MRTPALASRRGTPGIHDWVALPPTIAFLPRQAWACPSCGAALLPSDDDGTADGLECPWCLTAAVRPRP